MNMAIIYEIKQEEINVGEHQVYINHEIPIGYLNQKEDETDYNFEGRVWASMNTWRIENSGIGAYGYINKSVNYHIIQNMD